MNTMVFKFERLTRDRARAATSRDQLVSCLTFIREINKMKRLEPLAKPGELKSPKGRAGKSKELVDAKSRPLIRDTKKKHIQSTDYQLRDDRR